MLNCGPGDDVAFIRFSEKATTTTDGQCEKVLYVKVLTADEASGENTDTDAQAD